MCSASSLSKSAFFQPYAQKRLSCRVRRVIWNRRSHKTRARGVDAVELPESLVFFCFLFSFVLVLVVLVVVLVLLGVVWWLSSQ